MNVLSSIWPPSLSVCAYNIKKCMQPKSNKTHAGTKPIESIPVMTTVSSNASTTMVAYILAGCCYAIVVSSAGFATRVGPLWPWDVDAYYLPLYYLVCLATVAIIPFWFWPSTIVLAVIDHYLYVLDPSPGSLFVAIAGELGVLVVVAMLEGLAVVVEPSDILLPDVPVGHN